MSEAHHSPYTVHLGGTKMYRDVKGSYWWNNMKDIAKFVEPVFDLPTSESKISEASRNA
jgi:hypothetical protein